MRFALSIVLATLTLSSAGASTAHDFTWLSGYWLSCSDGREVAETWSVPRQGTLIGSTITLEAGKVSFEYARIASHGGRTSFFGSPGGKPAVEFSLKTAGERSVVFENLQHDFPHRVMYERRGDELIGRIEGTQDGKALAFEWRYRAAKFNTQCQR
jgi:hypothetical protein